MNIYRERDCVLKCIADRSCPNVFRYLESCVKETIPLRDPVQSDQSDGGADAGRPHAASRHVPHRHPRRRHDGIQGITALYHVTHEPRGSDGIAAADVIVSRRKLYADDHTESLLRALSLPHRLQQ